MTTTMTARPNGWTVQLPAGTYFLGDPCYAVPNDHWMPLLESCDYFEASPVGTLPDGNQVLAFSTAYGDGQYRDQHGHLYAVDAGMIGLTPVLPAPGWRYANEDLRNLGRIVTFDHPFTATTDGEGRLAFGPYEIDTAGDDEEADGW